MAQTQLTSFLKKLQVSKRTKPDFPLEKRVNPNEKESNLEITPARPPIQSHQPTPGPQEAPFLMPSFLRSENIRDINMRRPSDPNYDPTSLHIPPTEKLTPAMAQYWEIKKHHFEKIVLFKLGKFYEFFYYDAVIGQKLLDLRWMGNEHKKAHVGFPESSLEKCSKTLVDAGYQVMIVEQTETTLKNRKKKVGKTVGREITSVLTKSTLGAIKDDSDYNTKYLMSIIEDKNKFGVCMCDSSTSKFIIGECDEVRLKTLLVQSRPTEVLYNPLLLDSSIYKVVKNGVLPPIIRCLRNENHWSPISVYDKMGVKIPEIFSEMPEETVWRALAGCLSYLENLFLLEKLLPIAKFESLHQATIVEKLLLDSKALETLEILEAKENKRISELGSLFDLLDYTSTEWGKRLLKRWVTSPLLSVEAIIERQNAIEELKERKDITDTVDSVLKKQPDLERLFSRIAAFAIKTESKAVYFQDVSREKLVEFENLINSFCEIEYLIQRFEGWDLRSSKLLQLTKIEPDGHFPELINHLSHFEKKIEWKEGKPEPFPGIWPPFDQIKQEIKGIENELDDLLRVERERFMNSPGVNFVHSKFRYELEVPEYCLKVHQKPSHYEETSAKKGFERFYTPKIKSLTDSLEIAEEKLKFEMKPFIQELFSEFCEQETRWQTAISIIAQLDCLISLSKSARNAPYNTCIPIFTDQPRHFHATELTHPVLASRISTFVPNNVYLDDSSPIIVLTGPNMGGKSTILREVALATIMAQIGTFVPASSLTLSITDQIFTRMGASDSLIEGKSTFFVESEEAARIAGSGTGESLAIIDEFGRGTSTADGASLALAYLSKLSRDVRPRILFTTHYHMISEDMAEIEGVKMMHMDSVVEGSGRVSFLYELVEGVCRNSYALNVGRLAGLPFEVIDMADKIVRG